MGIWAICIHVKLRIFGSETTLISVRFSGTAITPQSGQQVVDGHSQITTLRKTTLERSWIHYFDSAKSALRKCSLPIKFLSFVSSNRGSFHYIFCLSGMRRREYLQFYSTTEVLGYFWFVVIIWSGLFPTEGVNHAYGTGTSNASKGGISIPSYWFLNNEGWRISSQQKYQTWIRGWKGE